MFSRLTILGGYDKDGAREPVSDLVIEKGQIYAIVGFTGSGKSQLIRDIEELAQSDTVSKRKVLLDNREPNPSIRFNAEKKVVAHLSQNMNFVLDMQVGEFLTLHAECRGFDAPQKKTSEVISCANLFAGEPIKPEYFLTSLSGGQSRSLMIADVAINSNSPVILIDELENAGIDKLKAMKILAEHGKIVLIVTHDPLLALFGTKRIIMKNGAMQKVLDLTEEEKQIRQELKKISKAVYNIQDSLRKGVSLTQEDTIKLSGECRQ